MHQPVPWQPQGVLIDLDNTLYDYWGAAARALEQFSAKVAEDFGVDAAEIPARYKALPIPPECERIRSGTALRRIRFGQLLSTFPECRGADVTQYIELYGQHLLDSIHWFPGAHGALLKLAQRVPVLIVTESREDIARPIMETLALGDWRSLCSYAHDVTKLDGSAFRLALEWMGLPADSVAVIGDSWEMDILGAAQVGIRQVWLPDDTVRQPEEIPPGFIGHARNFDAACRLLFPESDDAPPAGVAA